MPFSTRITGKAAKVLWIDGTGTVDLSGDRRTLEISDGIDTVEMSAGNDTAKAYASTLRELGASLTMMHLGTAGTATYARIQPGDVGTLTWGPVGTATGQIKGAFPAIVKSFNHTIPYAGAIEITVEFQPQGDYSSDPSSAVW